MNTTLSKEIIKIVQSEANDNPAPEQCTILESDSGYCKIRLNDGNILSNIPILGNPTNTTTGVIAYLDGEHNNPIIIPSTDETMNTILALGLGLFKIKSDGILYVELPNGIDNFFEIKNDGKLYVTLPSGASNDYHLESDKILYYNREDY